jgi:hypothetical protein
MGGEGTAQRAERAKVAERAMVPDKRSTQLARNDGFDLFELKAQSEYYAEIERNSDGRHARG